MVDESAKLRWLVMARCPYCHEWIELPGILAHAEMKHSDQPVPTIRKISFGD
jgi:hypothetical protein